MASTNSAWLEAYEAQKAKALERMNSSNNDTKKTHSEVSVTGLSSFSMMPKKGPKRPNEGSKPQNVVKKAKSKSFHEAVNEQKLASIEAEKFNKNPPAHMANHVKNLGVQPVKKPEIKSVQKPEIKLEASNGKKAEEKSPSVASLMKKVKSDAKLDVQDWQKAYEERKKAAMAALNNKKS